MVIQIILGVSKFYPDELNKILDQNDSFQILVKLINDDRMNL